MLLSTSEGFPCAEYSLQLLQATFIEGVGLDRLVLIVDVYP